MEQRIDKIEQALLSSKSQTASHPFADATYAASPASLISRSAFGKARSESAALHRASELPSMVTLNLSCSLGAFPASSMINVTLTDKTAHSGHRPDLISCGLISLDTAQTLFNFYQQHLDPCIHHILNENDTLASTRARSSLLTAAICTVAAFCSGSRGYQTCFTYYTNEVSGKMFSSKYTFDDVRALCIGSYWLNEVSSALNGLGK